MNEPKTWLSPTTVPAMLPWPRSLMLDHVCRGVQRAGICCNMFFIGYAVQFIKGSRVGPIQCLLNEPEINGYWTCRHPVWPGLCCRGLVVFPHISWAAPCCVSCKYFIWPTFFAIIIPYAMDTDEANWRGKLGCLFVGTTLLCLVYCFFCFLRLGGPFKSWVFYTRRMYPVLNSSTATSRQRAVSFQQKSCC